MSSGEVPESRGSVYARGVEGKGKAHKTTAVTTRGNLYALGGDRYNVHLFDATALLLPPQFTRLDSQ